MHRLRIAHTRLPRCNVAPREVQRVGVQDVNASRQMFGAEHRQASLVHWSNGGVVGKGQVTGIDEELRPQVEELVAADGKLGRQGRIGKEATSERVKKRVARIARGQRRI